MTTNKTKHTIKCETGRMFGYMYGNNWHEGEKDYVLMSNGI